MGERGTTRRRLKSIIFHFNGKESEHYLDDKGRLIDPTKPLRKPLIPQQQIDLPQIDPPQIVPPQIDPLIQRMLLQDGAINLDDLRRFCDPLPDEAKVAIIDRANHAPNELPNLDVDMIIQCMCILFEIPENVFVLLLPRDKIGKLFAVMLFILLRINMDYSSKQIILLVYLQKNLNKQRPHVPFHSQFNVDSFVRYISSLLLYVQQTEVLSTEEIQREQEDIHEQLLHLAEGLSPMLDQTLTPLQSLQLLMQQPQIQQLVQRTTLRQLVQRTLQLQIILIRLQLGLTVPTPEVPPPLQQQERERTETTEPTPMEIIEAEPPVDFGTGGMGDMDDIFGWPL